MNKIYKTMDEVNKDFFPNLVRVSMTKQEYEWWKINNPFNRRYEKKI